MTCLAFATSASAGELDLRAGLSVSAGFFDFDESNADALEAGVEYRFKPPGSFARLGLKPVLGGSVNKDEAFWIYGGLRLDYVFTRHWVVSPMFAVAFYEEGDSKDLGGSLHFRSGLGLSYRIDNGQTIGVAFYHLSNAGLEIPNPGSNSLVLVWSF